MARSRDKLTDVFYVLQKKKSVIAPHQHPCARLNAKILHIQHTHTHSCAHTWLERIQPGGANVLVSLRRVLVSTSTFNYTHRQSLFSLVWHISTICDGAFRFIYVKTWSSEQKKRKKKNNNVHISNTHTYKMVDRSEKMNAFNHKHSQTRLKEDIASQGQFWMEENHSWHGQRANIRNAKFIQHFLKLRTKLNQNMTVELCRRSQMCRQSPHSGHISTNVCRMQTST